MTRLPLFAGLAFLCAAPVAGPAVAAPANASSVADSAFDAAGFRRAHYRAPVDRPPAPATQISLADALLLKPAENALFIDVLPAEGGVRDSATGQWRLASPHFTIPGAQWHPETGRSQPDAALWRALRSAVAAARKASSGIPVVLFCRTDCWMGWNAARRLAGDGFANVRWLAEGIEGWHESGRELAVATPVAAGQGTKAE